MKQKKWEVAIPLPLQLTLRDVCPVCKRNFWGLHPDAVRDRYRKHYLKEHEDEHITKGWPMQSI